MAFRMHLFGIFLPFVVRLGHCGRFFQKPRSAITQLLRNRADAVLDATSSENLNRTSSDSNTFTQFSIFQGKPAFFGSQAGDETIDQKPKYGDYDLYVPYKSVISYRHIHNSGAPYQRTERSRALPYAYNHCTCKLCVATFTCNCCYCANYQYYLNGATQHEYIDGIHASF